MNSSKKRRVAIIGSGNIGTDLMIKILRRSQNLEVAAFVGIDPASDGLARARQFGVGTTHQGIDGLRNMPEYADIELVFDATSAGSHLKHAEVLKRDGKRAVDLTPAAVGPYVVPVVNLQDHLDAPNINMVTCGGQATVPIVAALSRATKVHYAEMVSSISSRSAGPGTRANIDEFTETTAAALEVVGAAKRGKAIIVLNPAEPPLLMRNTVFAFTEMVDSEKIKASVDEMVKEVQRYVPGYRLKQEVQFEKIDASGISSLAETGVGKGLKVSVFVEVEGAGHYLPKFAGNLDIMTSAALAAAEKLLA
jgi:acetaldehyde dehydrogenase